MGDRNITVREDKAPEKPPRATAAKTQQQPAATGTTLSAAADGCRCYVGNLAWQTTDEDLISTHTTILLLFMLAASVIRLRLYFTEIAFSSRRRPLPVCGCHCAG